MQKGATFSALLLCVMSTGCPFVVGDNLGAVKGRIVDDQGEFHRQCLVELLYPPNWEVFDHRNVMDVLDFQVSFIIGPGTKPYKARVRCATSETVFTSPVIMLGAHPIEPVDLGVIVLPKKPIVAQ